MKAKKVANRLQKKVQEGLSADESIIDLASKLKFATPISSIAESLRNS